MPEEIKQDVILKTQRYLGKYVKKPPLTDKLLRKPPFRFLHDVINAVIRETGFLKGLFSEEELNSENVKERDAKVAFLTKLIDAVKAITKTELSVRPSKIVAGLEPTETNILLQTIGKAIDKKLDTSEYTNRLNANETVKKSKKDDRSEKVRRESKKEGPKEKARTPRNHETPTKNDTPKSTDREKAKKRDSKESKSKTKPDDAKRRNKEKTKSKESTAEAIVEPRKTEVEDKSKDNENEISANVQTTDIAPNQISNERADDVPNENEPPKRIPSASRPKSARPKSGDRKNENREVGQNRPMSSLRPPSVRPSSARPGAPRLRADSAIALKEIIPMGKINVIVENVDRDADEEETVVIQSNSEVVEEETGSMLDVPKDKGHLVEQILEQISENDANSLIVEEKRDVFQGKDSTTKETNSLRSLIQSLTKTANPLGKLLNYLHEDIDTMQAELETWTSVKKQLFDEITKQKRISAELSKPLHSQLDHLKNEIKKMEEEIISGRSNILRNEQKIRELLSK